MSALIPIIIQVISGAAGGNLAGTLLKNLPLGKILRTVAGGVGGGLGGLILSVLGIGGVAAAGADPGAAADVAGAAGGVLEGLGGLEGLLKGVGGGGAGGGILVTIIGMIKKMMSGQAPG